MSCPHAGEDPFTPTSPTGEPNGNQKIKTQAKVVCVECNVEKRRRRIYRWKLIASLLSPAFLASVDATIVAPALTTIASQFGKLSAQLNWIVTAFTLTSTTFIPAFGQFADVYGRHSAIQVSLLFILIGSAFCAGAQTWGMLLFGRALQGIGSAGINNLIEIVLADNVSLEDNAKNNTMYTLASGIAFSVGPVIGGYLTEVSWRYVFVISVPIAVLAHILLFLLMRKELKKGTIISQRGGKMRILAGLGTLDIFGAVLFILGVGLIILAITWGGLPYAWDSAAVLVPLTVGSILFFGFFSYQYLFESDRIVARTFPKQVPMLPWNLFSKKDVSLLCAINFATGAAMFSAFYFISIYWNLAEGMPPDRAGLQLLYYIPGLGGGVWLAIFLCNKYPAQTFYPLFAGSIIEGIGIGLLAWAVTTRQKSAVNGMMALSGVGSGIRFMPASLHAAGIWPSRLAAVLSLLNFSAPFGGTIGISIMGSVFTNKFAIGVLDTISNAPIDQVNVDQLQSLDAIKRLPEDIQEQIRDAAARAIMWAFISILPIMFLSILASAMLGNVWVVQQKNNEKKRLHGSVLYSSFLLAMITNKVEERKEDVIMPESHASVEDAEQSRSV